MEKRHNSYEDLIVWQKADELAFSTYSATKNFPKEELFGLVSQMRRSAVSVPANIAEGYARASKKEKLHFYSIARGSLSELGYFIKFSFKLNYIDKNVYEKLNSLKEETKRLLGGFINYASR